MSSESFTGFTGVSLDNRIRKPTLPSPIANMCSEQAALPSADTKEPSWPVVQKTQALTGNLPRPPAPSDLPSDDEIAAGLHALRQKVARLRVGGGATGTIFGAGRNLYMTTTATNELVETVNGAAFKARGEMEIRKTAHGGEITEKVNNATYTAGTTMTLRREAANIGVTQEGVSSESALGSIDSQTTATERATINSSHSTASAGKDVKIGYHAENLLVERTNDTYYGGSDDRIIVTGKNTEHVVDGVKRSADASGWRRRGK